MTIDPVSNILQLHTTNYVHDKLKTLLLAGRQHIVILKDDRLHHDITSALVALLKGVIMYHPLNHSSRIVDIMFRIMRIP